MNFALLLCVLCCVCVYACCCLRTYDTTNRVLVSLYPTQITSDSRTEYSSLHFSLQFLCVGTAIAMANKCIESTTFIKKMASQRATHTFTFTFSDVKKQQNSPRKAYQPAQRFNFKNKNVTDSSVENERQRERVENGVCLG